jgi:hypothetical protein
MSDLMVCDGEPRIQLPSSIFVFFSFQVWKIDLLALNRVLFKLKMITESATSNDWKAILIDSQCQGGKTAKCFELLSAKVNASEQKTLVLYITQANNTAIVNQVIQRARCSPHILKIITPDCISKSTVDIQDDTPVGNMMIVDFWHSKNTKSMIDFVINTKSEWSTIIIVIDEVEQAGMKGVRDRLNFIYKLEDAAQCCNLKVIFITATIGNLSKCILSVAQTSNTFDKGIVCEIIKDTIFEHHYAEPYASYVGASWFKDTPGVWQKLEYPAKGTMTKDDYMAIKHEAVINELQQIPDSAKELSLIVTSTITSAHSDLTKRLLAIGYSVAVELNGKNTKNYSVTYKSQFDDTLHVWQIPYSHVDARADQGDLITYRNPNKDLIFSGIHQKDDYSLSHILQASLFMMTDAETRILSNSGTDEFRKLEALSIIINDQLPCNIRRPNNYPTSPRVAIVAGLIAGRGISIQNPQIDFTCTSFCFTDSKDGVQRGATNTQRMGRAFGMLSEVFARSERQPILIATERILRDAIANEMALLEKRVSIENGSLICLMDLITKADWERILQQANIQTVQGVSTSSSTVIDGVDISDLTRYFTNKHLLVGEMIRCLHQINDELIPIDRFRQLLNYEKGHEKFLSNIRSGQTPNSKYGRLWCVEGGMIQLNPILRAYLPK